MNGSNGSSKKAVKGARRVMSYVVPSTTDEFAALSWWFATVSGSDTVEMVGEESGHRPVWGLRAGTPPVSVRMTGSGSTVTAVVREVGDPVGLFDSPGRVYELEMLIPSGIGIDMVHAEASAQFKRHFSASSDSIEVWFTRKDYETVSWKKFGTIPKRPVATVHLAGGIETDVLADARHFLDPATKAMYVSFGRPYKRVYCLHGPPGTGKTSLVIAIASELGRPIAIFNTDSLRDDTFIDVLTDLPPDAIILFEDIDAMFKSRVATTETGGGGMTFSALINALDGVLHPRGALVFMTTNHLERLDPALRRPGRVDRMIAVPLARTEQVAALWKIAFPSGPVMPSEVGRAVERAGGVSPANTTEVLFNNREGGAQRSAAALVAAFASPKPKKSTRTHPATHPATP